MKKASPNLERFHRDLVEKIVKNAGPVGKVQDAFTQWMLWLLLSIGVMVLSLYRIKILNGPEVFHQMPPRAFLLTGFIGAALAAWEAIASSLPGRQTGKGFRWVAALTVLAFFMIPFFFFKNSGNGFDFADSLRLGMGCIEGVSLVGLIPWILIGWRISKNAAFHPLWAGAWSGLSAFLLGTVTVQLHCPNWTTSHMVLAHLLPAALLSFVATFAGAYWFSRWRD